MEISSSRIVVDITPNATISISQCRAGRQLVILEKP